MKKSTHLKQEIAEQVQLSYLAKSRMLSARELKEIKSQITKKISRNTKTSCAQSH